MQEREKTETLAIRLPPDLKRAFLAVCKARDETASQALRRAIRRAVEENRQPGLFDGR